MPAVADRLLAVTFLVAAALADERSAAKYIRYTDIGASACAGLAGPSSS
ncbi:MAG: hypothetical protein R3F14_06760 [Polyangiaceae bacterium]